MTVMPFLEIEFIPLKLKLTVINAYIKSLEFKKRYKIVNVQYAVRLPFFNSMKILYKLKLQNILSCSVVLM